MNTVLLILNSIICFCLFWVAGSFLLAAARVRSFRQAAIQLGLLLTMAGAFTSGLAPHTHDGVTLTWWGVLLRLGMALIAIAYYDQVFGVSRQLHNGARRLHDIPACLAAWWARKLHAAHDHAQHKHDAP